jgi:hypothetical protein
MFLTKITDIENIKNNEGLTCLKIMKKSTLFKKFVQDYQILKELEKDRKLKNENLTKFNYEKDYKSQINFEELSPSEKDYFLRAKLGNKN